MLIASAAIMGYYYTALQLDDRLLLTALCILGGVLLYNLIERWIVLAQKRLSITRAREKKEARLAAGEPTEDQEEEVDLDIPEVDLSTVREHAHGTVRAIVVVAVFIGLASVWAEVLPALGVFDRKLWIVQSQAGGEDAFRTITIGSLFISFVCIALTVVSARNLPGLLEFLSGKQAAMGCRNAICFFYHWSVCTSYNRVLFFFFMLSESGGRMSNGSWQHSVWG